MGYTPGRESREQSSERKTVVWGKVSKDWKVARNQKIKSGKVPGFKTLRSKAPGERLRAKQGESQDPVSLTAGPNSEQA